MDRHLFSKRLRIAALFFLLPGGLILAAHEGNREEPGVFPSNVSDAMSWPDLDVPHMPLTRAPRFLTVPHASAARSRSATEHDAPVRDFPMPPANEPAGNGFVPQESGSGFRATDSLAAHPDAADT